MENNRQDDARNDKIRILIVDDHAVVRQGLTRLVQGESDLTVAAEAENAVQALEAIDRERFDLAIVDISLEDRNGIELTAELKSRRPDMTVLILSMYDGLLYARRALRAGAAGYVAKYEAPEKIISAIHQVLAGKVYVSNSKTSRIMCEIVAVEDDDPDKDRISEMRSHTKAVHGVPDHT